MTIEQISLGLSTGTLFVLIYLVWYLQRLQREIDDLRKQIVPRKEIDDGTLPLPVLPMIETPPGTRMTEIEERRH
jgi:hypothetical protein